MKVLLIYALLFLSVSFAKPDISDEICNDTLYQNLKEIKRAQMNKEEYAYFINKEKMCGAEDMEHGNKARSNRSVWVKHLLLGGIILVVNQLFILMTDLTTR